MANQAGMNIVIPGASKNTGKFASRDYEAGDYELAINAVEWDESKKESDKCLTLKVSTTIMEGPVDENGKSPAGRKFTLFMKYHFGDNVADFVKERDVTLLVQLCNAAGLKIVKDKIPAADLPNNNIGLTLSYRPDKNDPEKKWPEYKFTALEAEE